MLALQGVTAEALARVLALDPVDARRIVSAVHRGRWGAAALKGVRRTAMDIVRAHGHVPSLELVSVTKSAIDPFLKLALRVGESEIIEAVRIPLERAGRFTACVSSQVGCALKCTFCATGRLGLARNLETWEIVEQVRVVRQTLEPPQRVHGVVFQGMGEPLANVDRTIEAIRVMCDPSALAIDARTITVCTSGLPTGIRRLARDAPKVRLGVSIASARRDVRRRLMPIDDAHPLDEVVEAVEEHARTTGLAPMWAVTPLAGVNDTEDDASALAELARLFTERTGVRPRVSVVPYNAIDSEGSEPFERGDVSVFMGHLAARGLRAHLRYSGGSDIGAACGQLAGQTRLKEYRAPGP